MPLSSPSFRLLPLLAGLVAFAPWSRAVAQGPAAESLATSASAALRTRNRPQLDALLPTLRAAASDRAAAPAALLLAWGRTEREAGNPDSAMVAFAALEAEGSRPGLGLLEQARVLLTRQLPEGLDPWYAGAARADAATWAEYRLDLQSVFTPAEAKTFDEVPAGAPREAWLRAFWAERERRDLRNPGTRLLEHYRRLSYARARFRLPERKRQYLPGAAVRLENADVDDRGLIYIRHGPPVQVARGGQDGPVSGIDNQPSFLEGVTTAVPPNETWRYDDPDGDRYYTFRACATPGPRSFRFVPANCVQPLDYQLVESVLDIFGPAVTRRVASGASTLMGSDSLMPSEVQQAVLVRAKFGERFARMLGADRFTLPGEAERERNAGRTDVQVGITTDSYGYRYPKALDARIEPLVAGRTPTTSEIHVAYAVRAGSLQPTHTEQGWLYPVHLKIQVRNERDSIVAMSEQRRVFRSERALNRRESLLGRVAVAVPTGALTTRIVLEHDEETGAATAPLPVTIPELRQGVFAGGDLVLGHGDVPLLWMRTPDDSVRFNPTGRFSTAAALELYHELYGLNAGQRIAYTLTVTREKGGLVGKVLGGKEEALTLSGEETAAGPISVIRRFLDISRLVPGKYVISAEYQAGNAKLRRARSFEVEAPASR